MPGTTKQNEIKLSASDSFTTTIKKVLQIALRLTVQAMGVISIGSLLFVGFVFAANYLGIAMPITGVL